MHIGIQTRGFKITPALQEYCDRRLRFAMGAAGGRVRNVLVRLTDENGPRGGVDKRCAIRAVLHNASQVIIVQDESDVYTAIDRAADRAARTIARRLDKTWSLRHTPASRRKEPPKIDALHPEMA